MSDARSQATYSWQAYLSFPSDERFELIDGDPYAMAPGLTFAAVSSEAHRHDDPPRAHDHGP